MPAGFATMLNRNNYITLLTLKNTVLNLGLKIETCEEANRQITECQAATFKILILHSVHPLFCWWVEPPTKLSRTGGRGGGAAVLTASQYLEGGFWVKGVWAFSGRGRGVCACSFYRKNKLKSTIFNDKKISSLYREFVKSKIQKNMFLLKF